MKFSDTVRVYTSYARRDVQVMEPVSTVERDSYDRHIFEIDEAMKVVVVAETVKKEEEATVEWKKGEKWCKRKVMLMRGNEEVEAVAVVGEKVGEDEDGEKKDTERKSAGEQNEKKKVSVYTEKGTKVRLIKIF